MKLLTSGWLLAALCLAACESQPQHYSQQQPVYDTPTTTTIVQPQPGYGTAPVYVDRDDNSGSLLTGMALGHMMANSGGGYNNNAGYSGGSSKKSKKVVNITKTYHYPTPPPTVSRPSYSRPSYSRPAPSYSRPAPAYRPSSIRSSSSMSSRAVRRR